MARTLARMGRTLARMTRTLARMARIVTRIHFSWHGSHPGSHDSHPGSHCDSHGSLAGTLVQLRPFDITLTWLSVSWWLEKFFINFSLISLCVVWRLCVAFFWRILRLWFLDRQLLLKRFVVVADGSENTML